MQVLVVENEANIADFLNRGLREEGYVVEHAADGTTAWNINPRFSLRRP
jgi:two-component system copper resistance phosphate regulon response regulator CusR